MLLCKISRLGEGGCMSELKMDAQRFAMLHTMLEENRKLIAALKTQRWEALKWAQHST